MLLLVSDANILIDMETGGLAAAMFNLKFRFAIPDVIYYEELEERHSHFLAMGLELRQFNAQLVERVAKLTRRYPRPGRNDLFALALAATEACPLLTGDKDLKTAAEKENIEVRGTLWLVTEMVRAGQISVHVARGAYHQMRNSGRRLPWDMAEEMLTELEIVRSLLIPACPTKGQQ